MKLFKLVVALISLTVVGATSTYGQNCQTVSKSALAQLREPNLAGLLQTSSSQEQPQQVPSFITQLRPGNDQEPVLLLSVTHNILNDLFSRGLAKNQSSSVLEAYRIGYLVYPQDSSKAIIERKGTLTTIPDGVKPGAQFHISSQGVNPDEIVDNSKMIVFFIAEAKLEDGTDWKPDINSIKSDYSARLNERKP